MNKSNSVAGKGMNRLVWLAAGALPLAVGYLLGVAAFAAWLRPILGLPGALAAVALSQAALGGVVIAVALPRRGPKAWGEPKDAAHRGGESGA